MIDIFRPILFCNGVTNCYNAFAGLLVLVSLMKRMFLPSDLMNRMFDLPNLPK
jgi:hypothetical protein